MLTALAGCARDDAPRPLPRIELIGAAANELRVDECRWVRIVDRAVREKKAGGVAIECSFTKVGSIEMLFLSWTGHAEDGANVDSDGIDGVAGMRPRESRRLHFYLAAPVEVKIARIDVEVN